MPDPADSMTSRLSSTLRRLPRPTGRTLLVLAVLLLAGIAPFGLPRGHGAAVDPRALLAALHPELQDRPLLVELHTRGCPACARMAPRMAELSRDCVGKRIGILALDVVEPIGESLARAYAVAGVPTVLLLDRNRAAEGRLIGEPSLSDLRAAAARLVGTNCGTQRPGAGAAAPLRAACSPPGPTCG